VENSNEYQHWSSIIKSLLKEAEIARQKGQWEKARNLLFEARKITKDFQVDRNLQ
jgi:hypothetical protein